MIPIRPLLLACSVVLVSVLALSGCGGSALASRQYYLVDVTRSGAPAAAPVPGDVLLQVPPFEVDRAFATKSLVYRVEASRYEPDFYRQFLVSPGVMMMEETRDWLASSGLFTQVFSADTRLEATHILEGNITDLYADFTTPAAPQAVLEIRFLLQAQTGTPARGLLTGTYRAVSPIGERTAEAVVEAFSRTLAEILSRLEADLQKVLAAGSSPPDTRTERPSDSPTAR